MQIINAVNVPGGDYMFDSIEDAIVCWKEDYSFIDDAELTGYKGGYPVVKFTINEAAWDLVKDEKKFKRIVRSAEMEGGIEVGVSTCFYNTASLTWEPPVMTICGYPEVIQRIIKKVF
jgi:hypothetical protein